MTVSGVRGEDGDRRSPNVDKILRDNLIAALRKDGHIPEDRIEAVADELQALAKKSGEELRAAHLAEVDPS